MARQITDLSAAGANLFHAVVELQRLRASSEKKFQKWFFETRAEHEKFTDMQARLERQMQVERQERVRAVTAWKAMEMEKVKAESLVKELKRELLISKEEARRAWEELGRREQEERDRVMSLRSGEPTLVGGVQVVPMQARIAYARHLADMHNRPSTRGGIPGDPPYPTSDNEYDVRSQASISPIMTDPYAGDTPGLEDPIVGHAGHTQYDGPAGLGITSNYDAGRSAGTIRGVPPSMSELGDESEFDVMTPGVGANEEGGTTPRRQRYAESLVSEEDYGTEIEPMHE
ncbi:hypothetical protein KEM55_001185, partial [Ascosphaera atra]